METTTITAREKGRPRTAWEFARLLVAGDPNDALPRAKPKERAGDAQLLNFIYRHRLAYPSLLRRRFPELLANKEQAKRAVLRLRQLGWVKVVPLRGVPRGWPWPVQATARGAQRLADMNEISTERPLAVDVWRRKGLAAAHGLHELCISELTAGLEWGTVAHAGAELLFLERRYRRRERRLSFAVGNRRFSAEPDAGALAAVWPPGKRPGSQFLWIEMDLNSETTTEIFKKLQEFHWWCESTDGRTYLAHLHQRFAPAMRKLQPRLLIVTFDPSGPQKSLQRAAGIVGQAQRLPMRVRSRVWVTTGENVLAGGGSLDREIWWKVFDSRKWREEFLAFGRTLQSGTTTWTQRQLRQFVEPRLAAQSQHRLFPPTATV